MAELSTILFDSDGVLAHTELLVFEINQEVFESLGIPYTKEDYIEHTFKTALGSSGWLQKNGYSMEVVKEFTEKRNKKWRGSLSSAELTEPSAPSILSQLAKLYLLGVVTNTQAEMFDLVYKGNDMRTLFKVVIFREDYKDAKPAPDAYLVALEKLGVSPNQTIVVEDSPRGIEAAHGAGLKVIGIANPDFPTLDIAKADYGIGSLRELPSLLTTLASET